MSIFTFPDVFNPVNPDGSLHRPNMAEAHVTIKELMWAAQMGLFDGRIYTTRAALYADLDHAADSWALVIGDPTSGYDGLYRKSGASGSGSWSRIGDVPGSGFISGSDTGAGTANAIRVTSPTIPAANGAALISFNIFEVNTSSPVTVSFNGATALTVKDNAGNDVQAGALKAGMIVTGYKSGSTFRLINIFGGEFLLATNVSGTNAIVATTPTPIPATAGAALIALPISIANTSSPVTVAFNGGAAITIKDSSGNDIQAGTLKVGAIVAGYISGSTFQLSQSFGTQFVTGADAGAGTANAIQVTTATPFSQADGDALISFAAFEANTSSPVTVAFNGGAALTIKTNSGSDIVSGGIVAGMTLLGLKIGSTFRLLSDQTSAAILAAAEDAADRAEAAAEAAESAVVFNLGLTDAVDRTPISKMREIASIYDFAVVADGVTNDTVNFQKAVTRCSGRWLHIPRGAIIYVTNVIELPSNIKLFGGGKIIAGPPAGFTTTLTGSAIGMLEAELKQNIIVDDVELDISAWTTLPSGTFSARCITFYRSSQFKVINCKMTTTGGGPAAYASTDYRFQDNEITCVVPGASITGGFADGVIDCWTEFGIDAESIIVTGNKVFCNGWGRWGIMLTALTFEASVMVARNIVVANNIVDDPFFDGIWAFGRNSTLDGANITGNVVTNGRTGISLSDARNCIIANNVIKDCVNRGIDMFSETADGGTLSVVDSVISGNVLHNCATVGGTGVIELRDDCSRNLIEGNNITGEAHTYGIYFYADAIGNREVGNRISQGLGEKVKQLAQGNHLEEGAYTPTLTGVANVTSASPLGGHFYAKNDRCVQFFNMLVYPTAGATLTTVAISLPIFSNIADDTLFGCAASDACSGVVFYDSVNNRALLRFTAPSTAAVFISGSFSYMILP